MRADNAMGNLRETPVGHDATTRSHALIPLLRRRIVRMPACRAVPVFCPPNRRTRVHADRVFEIYDRHCDLALTIVKRKSRRIESLHREDNRARARMRISVFRFTGFVSMGGWWKN